MALTSFKDILEARRKETSNFMWISREINAVVAYKQPTKPNPKWHKQQVLYSQKIQELLQKIQQEQGIAKEVLEHRVRTILDEIGFNKRLSVIRWLGLLLTKICLMVCSGIWVNESSVLKLKQIMGNSPVIFLPSHRSYADFILMSYVCFVYDIEIPSIAAGMDFHAMWVMGRILRDTGAFFMRRSFNNDHLYWDTFRQYILQLVTKGDLPIEFFIEGTRSRSGKFLNPKFGLLSMVLKPFFTSEVPDVLLIPINISYDRVLEEKLFVFELLGVPKPKETTSGFLRSLSIIKETYGNIYVDFGEPISARDYFGGQIDRSAYAIRPVRLQEIASQERELTSRLVYNIIRIQQKLGVVTAFNMVALSLNCNYICGKTQGKLEEMIEDIIWLRAILEVFGAQTNVTNPRNDVLSALDVHKGLVQIDENSTLSLVKNCVTVTDVDLSKLRGHNLSQETMSFVVPFLMLQFYVNPILHYFVNPAIVVTVLKQYHKLSREALYENFAFLRLLLSYEFVACESWKDSDFEESIEHLQKLNVIIRSDSEYYLTQVDDKLESLLHNILSPFILVYRICCEVLNQASPCSEKSITITTQAQLESIILKSKTFIHPYILNLDTLSNCLNSLTAIFAIKKCRKNGEILCQADHKVLSSVIEKLDSYVELKLEKQYVMFTDTKISIESKL